MVQAQNQPFKFQEVFNLTSKGLSPENFKMGMMTFESPKYICIKEASVSSLGLVPPFLRTGHSDLKN